MGFKLTINLCYTSTFTYFIVSRDQSLIEGIQTQNICYEQMYFNYVLKETIYIPYELKCILFIKNYHLTISNTSTTFDFYILHRVILFLKQ